MSKYTKKLALYDAERITTDCDIDNGTGTVFHATAGDWKVTNPDGRMEIYDTATFERIFEPVDTPVASPVAATGTGTTWGKTDSGQTPPTEPAGQSAAAG